jgi:5'-nucleotidase
MDTQGHTTDFEAVNEGYISITPIQLDMTAHDEIQTLQEWLNDHPQ